MACRLAENRPDDRHCDQPFDNPRRVFSYLLETDSVGCQAGLYTSRPAGGAGSVLSPRLLLRLRTGGENLLLEDGRTVPDYGCGHAWHFAHSSLFGLVAAIFGTLYRVRIDECEPLVHP